MSASNSEMQSNAENSLDEALSAGGITEWQVRTKRVVRDPAAIRENLAAILTLRGLQSSRRGMNLGQIDKPA